jgi:hypothetical protein
MKQKIFRLPDSLADDFEKFAKQKWPSENQAAEEALKHFMECTKTATVQSMRLIPLKFKGACNRCGREVDQGEWAWWAPGAGLICTDCEVKKFGDKTTARRYVKVKELEFTEKALRQECDKLAEKLRGLSLLELMDDLHNKGASLYQLAMDYLKSNKSITEGEKQALEQVLKAIEENKIVAQEVREYSIAPWKKKKKWPERVQEAEQEAEQGA